MTNVERIAAQLLINGPATAADLEVYSGLHRRQVNEAIRGLLEQDRVRSIGHEHDGNSGRPLEVYATAPPLMATSETSGAITVVCELCGAAQYLVQGSDFRPCDNPPCVYTRAQARMAREVRVLRVA